MSKPFEEIWAEATKAADTALVYATVEIGGPNARDTCGGAYLLVKPARGPFITWLKKQGIGDRGVYGGWDFSNPVRNPSQSYTVARASAKAFAEVLKAHGINCSVKSYVD